MKVKDFRELFNSLPKEFDDHDVCVYADHGQLAFRASQCEKGYIEDDGSSGSEVIHEDDADEDCTEVFIIE